jgi:hypothetical protein
MGRKNQRAEGEEKEIMKYVSSIFPTFLGGVCFAQASTDPPDLLGESADGCKIGLELTYWLSDEDVSAALGRELMRKDLLGILESEKHPCPKNFRFVVIMPRWGKMKKDHYQAFCTEFHAATQYIDAAWKTLRDEHWEKLTPEKSFDYLMDDFSGIKRYPTLRKYLSSIWFNQPAESGPAPLGKSWISIISDGGSYDPAEPFQTLRHRVESKVDHHQEKGVKERLDALNLHKLYLLVHTDLSRSSYKTPYQVFSQPTPSLAARLTEAAIAGIQGLCSPQRAFDGIFLLYHLWNVRWLAQIWPTFQHIPAIDSSLSSG